MSCLEDNVVLQTQAGLGILSRCKKGRAHCSARPHLLFTFTDTLLYPMCQTAQTKAQEIGGTDQDSHWAATIKGTLTQADAQVVQQFSFHVAYASLKIMQESAPFLFASIVLHLMSCTTPSIKSMLAHTLTKYPNGFCSMFISISSPRCTANYLSKKTHDNTLQKWSSSSAVTKLRVRTTATMRVSWWATPARAQTEQLAAQRPTNKCFHIYPPPPLWDSWGLNGKQDCGCKRLGWGWRWRWGGGVTG